MAETVEELTFNYEDEGRLVRKELTKEVLSKGAWATLMFLYQEMDRKTGMYRDPKVSIVRFKKAHGVYRKQSSFNISSEKQGRQIIEVLERWFADDGPAKNSELLTLEQGSAVTGTNTVDLDPPESAAASEQ
jgi:hypothetical protein